MLSQYFRFFQRFLKNMTTRSHKLLHYSWMKYILSWGQYTKKHLSKQLSTIVFHRLNNMSLFYSQ